MNYPKSAVDRKAIEQSVIISFLSAIVVAIMVMIPVVTLQMFMGCSSESTDDDSSHSTVPIEDDTSDSDDVQTGWMLCQPGESKGCDDTKRAVTRCADDGSAWITEACLTDMGTPSICYDGACLECMPLDKRCRNDDEVEMCSDDGSEWLLGKTCNGAVTGQVCETGSCVALCELSKKWNSYMGCEYWGADLDNGFVAGSNGGALDAAGAQYALIVSNPSPTLPAEVEIYDSDGKVLYDADQLPLPQGKILPRSLRTYKLPRRDVNGTVQAHLAYRVTSSIPVTVYQFNPLADEEVYSNDASLLLPANVLDRWYFVMTREQGFEGIRAYMTVVGTRPDTQVNITVSARTLAGEGIPSMEPGESITRNLEAFEVLNLETDAVGDDLTGSMVVSTKRVAVFGGSEGANVPNSNRCDKQLNTCEYDGETPCEKHEDCSQFITCCADHIEQQLFPVEAWGTRYLCHRTAARGDESEYWRILAAEDGTVVETIPPTVANIPVLDAGEWFELSYKGDFEISANKPLMVGRFMAAEHAPEPGQQPNDAGIGDPAFMLAVPVEQFRMEYVFLTPPDFERDFVNVVTRPGTVVTLDGEQLGDEQFDPVGTGEYWVARMPVSDGVHTLVSDQPSGVVVYGYDQYVSYGYPGGLDLKRLDLIKPPNVFE